MRRRRSPPPRRAGATIRVTLLDVPLLDVSSSDIRERAAQGRPIRYLVPHRVEQYILETGLYR